MSQFSPKFRIKGCEMPKGDQKNSALSDEELMSLYQGGDFASFEILYGRHSGRVFEYLKKRIPLEPAQDLLQEIFEKLHKSRAKYNPQYPFLPWLFAISRNALMDFYKLSETKLVRAAIASEQIIEQLAPQTNTSSAPDISLALGELPTSQKRAIELRYLQDWSFEQIAKDMNTSQENARQLISRGVKKLRKLLGNGGSYGS